MRKSLTIAVALWASTPAFAQQPGAVSQMPFASTPYSGSELLYVIQNGVSKKSTLGSLKDFIAGFTPVKVVNLATFGAVCDGVLNSTAGTDNADAINAWLAQAGPGVALVAGEGVCNFKRPLRVGYGVDLYATSIKGQGLFSTVFQYTGSDTTIDLFAIGSGVLGDSHAAWNLDVGDFRITSAVPMTAGFGAHLWHVIASRFDVVMDGQYGSGNLYGGTWFDEVAAVSAPNTLARAKADIVRVNGSRPSEPWWPQYVSDVNFGEGKISSELLNSASNNAVGMHIAGGVGGATCTDLEIIGNKYNLLVDQAVTGTGNQSFNTSCFHDTPQNGGASILINDSSDTSWQGGSKIITIDRWSAGFPGLRDVVVQNWNGGTVNINGAISGGTYGLEVDDENSKVNISSSASIYNNSTYGIYSTVANPKINLNNPILHGNTTADLSANVFSSTLPLYYSGGSCSIGIAIGGSTAGITYSGQLCSYQLVGFDVNVDLTLFLSSKGAGTGNLTLTGFPVPTSSSYGGGNMSIGYATNWSGLTGALIGNVGASSVGNIYQSAATGIALTTDSNLTNTSTLLGTITYHR